MNSADISRDSARAIGRSATSITVTSTPSLRAPMANSRPMNPAPTHDRALGADQSRAQGPRLIQRSQKEHAIQVRARHRQRSIAMHPQRAPGAHRRSPRSSSSASFVVRTVDGPCTFAEHQLHDTPVLIERLGPHGATSPPRLHRADRPLRAVGADTAGGGSSPISTTRPAESELAQTRGHLESSQSPSDNGNRRLLLHQICPSGTSATNPSYSALTSIWQLKRLSGRRGATRCSRASRLHRRR